MTNEERQITREELKIEALLQRVAALEGEKADLRVDLTVYANEVNRLQQEVVRLEALVPENEPEPPPDAD